MSESFRDRPYVWNFWFLYLVSSSSVSRLTCTITMGEEKGMTTVPWYNLIVIHVLNENAEIADTPHLLVN